MTCRACHDSGEIERYQRGAPGANEDGIALVPCGLCRPTAWLEYLRKWADADKERKRKEKKHG